GVHGARQGPCRAFRLRARRCPPQGVHAPRGVGGQRALRPCGGGSGERTGRQLVLAAGPARHKRGEPVADGVDLGAEHAELVGTGAALLAEAAHHHEPFEVHHEVVELAEGGGALQGDASFHAASSRMTTSSSCSSAGRGRPRKAAAVSAPRSATAARKENAAWKPWVSASAGATPVSSAATVAAMVVTAAMPTAPPIWRVVLIRPEAMPASAGETPWSAAIVTGTNVRPRPIPVTISAGKTSQK